MSFRSLLLILIAAIIMCGIVTWNAIACSASEADYRVERLMPPPLTIQLPSMARIPTTYELFRLYLDTLDVQKNLLDTKNNLYKAYRCSQIINKHFEHLPMNLMGDFVRYVHAMPIEVKKHRSHPSARRKGESMKYINQLSFLVLHEEWSVEYLTKAIIREYDKTQEGIK